MFARRERHISLYLVIVVVIFFAGTCRRHLDFFGDVLAIQGELEARSVTRCSDSREHGVVPRFLHVHGVFKPVTFAVVAHNNSSCLLVKVNTGTCAVVAVAMVFGIAIVVRGTVLALARHVEVFCLNLARESNGGAVFTCGAERSLRNRFRASTIKVNFIVRINTDLEPVKVRIAARLLCCKVEEAPTHTHEHVEVVIEFHVATNF